MTLAEQQEWERECLKWRSHVLTGKRAHYCYDWDGLPVDETTEEYSCCQCKFDDEEHPR